LDWKKQCSDSTNIVKEKIKAYPEKSYPDFKNILINSGIWDRVSMNGKRNESAIKQLFYKEKMKFEGRERQPRGIKRKKSAPLIQQTPELLSVNYCPFCSGAISSLEKVLRKAGVFPQKNFGACCHCGFPLLDSNKGFTITETYNIQNKNEH